MDAAYVDNSGDCPDHEPLSSPETDILKYPEYILMIATPTFSNKLDFCSL